MPSKRNAGNWSSAFSSPGSMAARHGHAPLNIRTGASAPEAHPLCQIGSLRSITSPEKLMFRHIHPDLADAVYNEPATPRKSSGRNLSISTSPTTARQEPLTAIPIRVDSVHDRGVGENECWSTDHAALLVFREAQRVLNIIGQQRQCRPPATPQLPENNVLALPPAFSAVYITDTNLIGFPIKMQSISDLTHAGSIQVGDCTYLNLALDSTTGVTLNQELSPSGSGVRYFLNLATPLLRPRSNQLAYTLVCRIDVTDDLNQACSAIEMQFNSQPVGAEEHYFIPDAFCTTELPANSNSSPSESWAERNSCDSPIDYWLEEARASRRDSTEVLGPGYSNYASSTTTIRGSPPPNLTPLTSHYFQPSEATFNQSVTSFPRTISHITANHSNYFVLKQRQSYIYGDTTYAWHPLLFDMFKVAYVSPGFAESRCDPQRQLSAGQSRIEMGLLAFMLANAGREQKNQRAELKWGSDGTLKWIDFVMVHDGRLRWEQEQWWVCFVQQDGA